MQEGFFQEEKPLIFFWAFGDLHYLAQPDWNKVHTRRLEIMFADLHQLWKEMGQPAFCVSPGDIVETYAQENYELASARLQEELGSVPFYPGIGNHEFKSTLPIPLGDGKYIHRAPGKEEDPVRIVQAFTQTWGKSIRYAWQIGDAATCIMLDYPNPFHAKDPRFLYLEQETLAFLDAMLDENKSRLTLIFLHCPLYSTVGERDGKTCRDHHSWEHFFALEPESSEQVRAILAQHQNACLFFSGHTHAGWEAPQIVATEQLGNHPVTFVNLMSPWFTGIGAGNYTGVYIADNPDVIPTFAVNIYSSYASLRVRDHRTQQWLKEWIVPLKNGTLSPKNA